MSDQPSIRSGGTPTTIDPKEYPALAELQKHCRRKGPALIDRAYDDALRMWQRLKEAEDIAGLGPCVITEAFGAKDVWGEDRKPSAPKVQRLAEGEELL